MKELDITEFSNDYINYTPELRIEALILPADNTAIVRIDKSVKINNTDLYDCRDSDYGIISQDDCLALGGTWHGEEGDELADCGDWVSGEWVCWDCVGDESNYGNAPNINNPDECLSACLDAGYTEVNYLTADDLPTCMAAGGRWSWFIINDIGIDGVPGDPTDDDGDCEDCSFNDSICQIECISENSIGEGNGIPDCNEQNVDETDEIIPNIHVKDCLVTIRNGSLECSFIYDENAGSFLYDANPLGWEGSIANLQTPTYGAYVPSNSTECSNFNWADYDAEYSFECNCPNYDTIISESTVQISPPVVFFAGEENINESINSQGSTCDDDICLKGFSDLWNNEFSKYDTLYYGKNSYNEFLYYSSINPYFWYQSVQYFYDETQDRYLYLHGHIDGAADESSVYGSVSLMAERIVTSTTNEFIEDININQFYYEMFTFSDSYKNYYFFDSLDLKSPVRTNLRNSITGQTIMGAFGSMTSSKAYFRIIDCEQYVSEESCLGESAKQVCSWYNYTELPDLTQEFYRNSLTTSSCEQNICSGGMLNGQECESNEDCEINFEDIPLEMLNICGPNNLP